jgi:hypothetical protein
MHNISDEIEEKQIYLNKLVSSNSSNLISIEIIKTSQELDMLICQYYSSNEIKKEIENT